jgi:mono/diheme cytochrome c family protein
MRRNLTRREWGVLGAVLAGLFGLAQLVPVGAPRSNPPVLGEPSWDSPRTRELFFRACADCHSNQTRWPWYSHVAPVSWLVAHDVAAGRRHLDVSEWTRPQKHARHAAEQVREGEMPLAMYLPMHAEARLTAAEKSELIAGLEATFGRAEKGQGGQDDEGDDD